MQYLLLDAADLETVRANLDQHLTVKAGRVRAGTKTFYDTFDGRLHDAGVTLRHAAGRLTLTDRATGEPLAGAEAPARAEQRLFDHDLGEELHARLADVIEMRALTPVARVRTREITLGVLNDDLKTVVRLNVETHEGLSGRLSATAVRGYESRPRADRHPPGGHAQPARGDRPARRRGDRRRPGGPSPGPAPSSTWSSTPPRPRPRPPQPSSPGCSR